MANEKNHNDTSLCNTNLLVNSEFEGTFENFWDYKGGAEASYFDTLNCFTGVKSLHIVQSQDGNNFGNYIAPKILENFTSTDLHLGFMGKALTENTRLHVEDTQQTMIIPIGTNAWEYYQVELSMVPNSTFKLWLENPGECLIALPKLEIGDIGTRYVPNKNDVAHIYSGNDFKEQINFEKLPTFRGTYLTDITDTGWTSTGITVDQSLIQCQPVQYRKITLLNGSITILNLLGQLSGGSAGLEHAINLPVHLNHDAYIYLSNNASSDCRFYLATDGSIKIDLTDNGKNDGGMYYHKLQFTGFF